MAMPSGKEVCRSVEGIVCIENETIITYISSYGKGLFSLNGDYLAYRGNGYPGEVRLLMMFCLVSAGFYTRSVQCPGFLDGNNVCGVELPVGGGATGEVYPDLQHHYQRAFTRDVHGKLRSPNCSLGDGSLDLRR